MVVSATNTRLIALALLGLGLSACAASKSNAGGSAGSGAGGSGTATGTGGTGTAAATAGSSNVSDTKPVGTDLQIAFNPMYSGYDGMRTFRVPAIVPGLTGVQWSASDASYVSLESDPSTGGVMITTKKAGTVKIIARSGALSGSADLTITAYNSADCEAGDNRYNNMKGIDGGSVLSALNANTPKDVSCKSCHGEGAQFLSVQHTPQQTAGWTDDDITNILAKGFKPDGSVFVTMVPPPIYQMFHKWQVTEQEKIGIVCYLRSLEPKSQGMLDFQGLMRPAGGGGTMMTPAAGTGGAAGH